MKALALHATKNVGSKHDASGAFVPEAVAFQRLYACHRAGFDNLLEDAKRRAAVEASIRAYRELELVAIFCHGLRRWLQTEHDLKTVGALADAIAEAAGAHVVVALYACSTGARDDGFASALRAALHARGKTGHVDAHTNAAHTTRNPNVRRFIMGETTSTWLVEPGSPDWKAWRAALKGEMRFRFPTLTAQQVCAALHG